MAQCEKIRRQSKRICIGALNKRITINSRAIGAPVGTEVDFTETFTKRFDTWAMIETIDGKTIFDDTNIERVITHDFFIRYVPNITFQDWILYNGKYYDIVRVENFQEDNRFYRIRSAIRGDKDLPVNFA